MITDPSRLLPAHCPRWALVMGTWFGGLDWQPESLAARSFAANPPGVARVGRLQDEYGQCYIDLVPWAPGKVRVDCSVKRRLPWRQPPLPETCHDPSERLAPIRPRFRRRRCACGAFSMRRLSAPPICAEGLEHARKGCALVAKPFSLADYFEGERLRAAQAEADKLVRLVRFGIAPDETAH